MLFAFCVFLISYMILSVIKAALCSVHGTKKIEKKVSGYYLADEISGTYRGMMIAIEAEEWVIFRKFTQTELIRFLKKLSKNVKLFSVSKAFTWSQKNQ